MRAGSFAIVVVLLGAGCSRRAEPAPNEAGAPAQAAASYAGRASLECLTIDAPPGSTKTGGVGGGLSFTGSQKLRSGTVSYEPAFTVSTQAADGNDSNAIRDELMKSFTEQYAQSIAAASRATGASAIRPADLQPPKSVPQPVAGTRGHAWQIDSIATFNGEQLPWRAFSMTTVYRDRVYVVTAAAALSDIGALKPLADRFFASMRFDGCK